MPSGKTIFSSDEIKKMYTYSQSNKQSSNNLSWSFGNSPLGYSSSGAGSSGSTFVQQFWSGSPIRR